MTGTNTQWLVQENGAVLSCGPLRAFVDVKNLHVTNIRWHEVPCDGLWIMRIKAPFVRSKGVGTTEVEPAPRPKLMDHFVRGNDLIASFAQTPPLTSAPEVYWRAREEQSSSAVRLEIVLSMKTDLLNSEPHSVVNGEGRNCEFYHVSVFGSGKVRQILPGAPAFNCDRSDSTTHLFLLRNHTLGLTYAEMVHPTDFAFVDAFAGPVLPPHIHWHLFPERLEKGVIRRARICGWFMPVENDLATAVELAKRFVAEPPPLTT